MGRPLFVACLVAFAAHCKGIELTFDRNNDPSTSVCAILNCQLNGNSGSSEEPTIPSDLSVFRVLPLESDGKNSGKEMQEVVSLSSNKRRVTSFSEDYNINGVLSSSQQMIRIYIKNRDYCSADFACRVRGTNFEGKELTSTTLIHMSQGEATQEAAPETDEKLTQIMKQVRKLDRKLYSMGEKNKKLMQSLKQDLTAELAEALSPVRADLFDVKFELSALISATSSRDQEREADSSCCHAAAGLQALIERLADAMNDTAKVVNTLAQGKNEATTCQQQDSPSDNTSLEVRAPNVVVISNELFPGACKKMDPLVQVSAEKGILAEPFPCDMFLLGGGWIVIQRRATGNVNFFRDWEDYKTGFGEFDGDFWLGNEKLHAMTSTGNYELRVELEYKGERRYAHYQTFAVGDEASNYKLTVMDYDGNAGDSLGRHDSIPFSTKDRDNDLSRARNCATKYYGGWWYINCHDSNLNGEWNAGGSVGPAWTTFTRRDPASFTEMKIRLRLEEP